MCFVIGRISELKQSNDDHLQGIKISFHVVCTTQSIEVEHIDKRKHLVLMETICSQSARTTNYMSGPSATVVLKTGTKGTESYFVTGGFVHSLHNYRVYIYSTNQQYMRHNLMLFYYKYIQPMAI